MVRDPHLRLRLRALGELQMTGDRVVLAAMGTRQVDTRLVAVDIHEVVPAHSLLWCLACGVARVAASVC